MRLINSLLCLTVLIAHTVGASLLSREGHGELVPEKLPLGFHDADSAASGAAAQSDSDGVIAVVVTDSLLDAFKSVSSSAVKIVTILGRSRKGDDDAINAELRSMARVIQTTSTVLRALTKEQTPNVRLNAYDDHSISQVVFQIVAKVTRTFLRVLKDRGYYCISNRVRKELGDSLGHLLTTVGSLGAEIPLRVVRAIRDHVYLRDGIKFSRDGREYRVQLVYDNRKFS